MDSAVPGTSTAGEGPSGAGGSSSGGDGSKDESGTSGMYECNICLDTARDAVVSMCGHLFCWPCLHQWLETRPTRQTCPVCKAGISKDKVIPLYGRGNTKQEDPREKLPPRPAGQRSEPESSGAFPGFGFADGGFQMSFGIGAFPFGIFASSLNLRDGRPAPHAGADYEQQQQHRAASDPLNVAHSEFMSKLFLGIAILFIAWIIIL